MSGVRVHDHDDVARLGCRRASATSAWFKAPAFFSVLATVVKTSSPCSLAMTGVSSVQLSATTTTRSGGLVCPQSEGEGGLDGEGLVVGRHQDRQS